MATGPEDSVHFAIDGKRIGNVFLTLLDLTVSTAASSIAIAERSFFSSSIPCRPPLCGQFS